jgi:hypothetical protein
VTQHAKKLYEQERAHKIIAAWKTAPISELEWACKIYDGALLLLIQRMADGG